MLGHLFYFLPYKWIRSTERPMEWKSFKREKIKSALHLLNDRENYFAVID